MGAAMIMAISSPAFGINNKTDQGFSVCPLYTSGIYQRWQGNPILRDIIWQLGMCSQQWLKKVMKKNDKCKCCPDEFQIETLISFTVCQY